MSEVGEPVAPAVCKTSTPEPRAGAEPHALDAPVPPHAQRAGSDRSHLRHARRRQAANEAPSPARCSTAEYRQFDFWIGDWDTFEMEEPNGPSIARAEITPIVSGCALHERYEQSDGLVGDSILSFDPVRRQWQQTWITNRGSNMVLWGELLAQRSC
jgi:hypothetical protein